MIISIDFPVGNLIETFWLGKCRIIYSINCLDERCVGAIYLAKGEVMFRRFLICAVLFGLSVQFARGDTNIDILGEVILKKNRNLYIDKGRLDNVELGYTFEIIYDGKRIGNGVITWVGEYICAARIDSLTFSRLHYLYPLEVKIIMVSQARQSGGTLHLAYYDKPGLYPWEIITPDEQSISNLIYEGLVATDEQGGIVPCLAHSWEVHGSTYTFYLDPDVKFHSGKPLEALDVSYSLTQLARAQMLTPATSFVLEIDGYEEVHRGRSNELRGIFIPGKYTIAITTKDVFVPFLKYLAGPGGYITQAVTEGELPLPVGTGPFIVVDLSDNRLTLVANRYYARKPAVVDSLIFNRYDSRKEAALDFELGRLDLLWFDSESDRDLLTGGDYATQRYYTNSSVMLGFNCRHDYEKDLALSAALQYMFDKESIARVILGGAARTNPGLAPPALALQSGAREYYFAPVEARELIDDIKNLPDTLVFRYSDLDPQLEAVAGYIAGQLRQAGLKTNVQKWHPADAAHSGFMDLYLFRYDLPLADYDAFFYPLFAERLAGQTNYLYYINPQLEKFLQGARRIDDTYARKDVYAEAERTILDKPPVVMLYNPIMTIAFRRDLAGFEFDPKGFVDLRKIYFKGSDH